MIVDFVKKRYQKVISSPATIVGLTLLGFLTIVAVLGPSLVGDPLTQAPERRLLPPFWAEGGDLSAPLGTDPLGRDMLARIVYGTRVSLGIGVASVILASIIGTLMGLISGYYRGLIETVVMRLSEAQLAFPLVLLALFIMAFVSPSIPTLIVVFAVAGWPHYAKIVRGLVLDLREREYMQAAEAVGASDARQILVHLFPNIRDYSLILCTLQLGNVIIAEAGLSFIGVGVPPPTPSWGVLIGEGRDYLANAWWVSVLPGLTVILAGFGFNLLSDGLRDITDPKRIG